LDFLEHALELVLGSMQLTRKPHDVGSSGHPQVSPHQVDRVERDPGKRRGVLGAERQQPAEARLAHQLLERLGRTRFGLLEQRARLLLWRLRTVASVYHRLSLLRCWPV